MAARKEVEENHNGRHRLRQHGSDAVLDRGDEDNGAKDMGSV